jgi:hypothetical protein
MELRSIELKEFRKRRLETIKTKWQEQMVTYEQTVISLFEQQNFDAISSLSQNKRIIEEKVKRLEAFFMKWYE